MSSETFLTHPSDEQLLHATQENLFALFRAMAASLPESEIVENDQLAFHLAFPFNPMFKGVWRTHLTESDADAAIDATLTWFKERNAPFLFWWTGLGSTPDDLGKRLIARGLISMEQQMEELAPGIKSTEAGAPCMVAELSRMNEAVLDSVPPGFIIEEIQAESHLYAFKQVFVESYEIPEWAGQAWVDATLKIGIGRTPWRIFVGWLNDEPVATNILFNGAGVASVYGVATSPSARGKGIGGAITLKPLLDARATGYRYAALFATEMGIHAYERIGFRLVNARINRYLWRNG
ncbi:MAG: GNAT family N-acetyltransferase [Anaerolineae bacterium]|nr:GNAT family N-acetyltransferase [Anaerolineae bacterium]